MRHPSPSNEAPSSVDLPMPAAHARLVSASAGAPIRGRPLRHADLEEARHVLPTWLQMPAALRERLPVLWTRLLGQSGFSGDVIEDLSRPPGQRMVGLGVTVALDDAWVQRMCQEPPVHAGAAWYQDFMDGRTAPLDDRALGLANAQGRVGKLVLHYGQVLVDPQELAVQQILLTAMQLFRQAHGGLQLAHVWQEALGSGGDYLLGMGFKRRTQRGGEQPDLFGLSRDEAATLFPGTPVRDVFQFVPPVMGFTGAERRMLRLAVLELSDEEVANELGVSQHTLKKLWRSVYDRATAALPHMFDATEDAADGTRGPEKRRHLLHYVRQHLEELRPYG